MTAHSDRHCSSSVTAIATQTSSPARRVDAVGRVVGVVVADRGRRPAR